LTVTDSIGDQNRSVIPVAIPTETPCTASHGSNGGSSPLAFFTTTTGVIAVVLVAVLAVGGLVLARRK
jgi:hypothetical protein